MSGIKNFIVSSLIIIGIYVLFAVLVKLVFGISVTGMFGWGVVGGMFIALVTNAVLSWARSGDEEEEEPVEEAGK